MAARITRQSRCGDCGRLVGNSLHTCSGTSWNKGRQLSEEHKQKLRDAKIGKKLSPEHREKVIKTLLVDNPYRFKKGDTSGEKSNTWKGGISKHPDYRSKMAHNRRVRKNGNGGFHTIEEWSFLKAQYNWTCPCCKKQEPIIKLTKDHIVPLYKGGSDNIENLQPLCRSCNSKKRTKIIRYEL